MRSHRTTPWFSIPSGALLRSVVDTTSKNCKRGGTDTYLRNRTALPNDHRKRAGLRQYDDRAKAIKCTVSPPKNTPSTGLLRRARQEPASSSRPTITNNGRRDRSRGKILGCNRQHPEDQRRAQPFPTPVRSRASRRARYPWFRSILRRTRARNERLSLPLFPCL